MLGIPVRLSLSVARALCTRKALERSSLDVDFTAIDQALLEIGRQVKELDDIRGWTETIRKNGEKIIERLSISREKLEKQGEVLTERVADLKEAMTKG
jgi:phage-related minor tail protein